MELQEILLLPILGSWLIAGLLSIRLPDRVRCPAAVATALFLTGFLTVLYLVANEFTGEGINEAVVVHTLYGADGIGIWQFPELLLITVASVVALAGSSYALFRYLTRRRAATHHAPAPSHARVIANAAIYGLLLFSLTAHPAVLDTLQILEKHGYRMAADTSDFAQYLHPIQVAAGPRKPRNIIYLYVESLERTYFDERRFPGLIRELRELERHSLSFTDLRQVRLTDWTIAGMTASQCGIPLSTFGRPNEFAEHERFLPGATCLGDILSADGYTLAYRGGADLNFAGKGRFYTEHGFHDVRGLQELLRELPPDEPVSRWGIYDDRLLDLLIADFAALSAAGKPFGLFALTLDTHAPNGHETPACRHIRYQDGKNPLLNAVACTDHLVARFIRRILDSPGAHDTLLVVGSDHLAMRGATSELLDKKGPEARRNLLLIFNSGRSPAQIAKPGSTLDVWPTVLHLMGYESDGLALGRNLLTPEPTLVERVGLSDLNAQIERWRLGLFTLNQRD